MLFSSYEFIFLFLPITFFTYYFLTFKKLVLSAKVWLVFSSLFFYSWWDIIYLPLILFSILFNYKISRYLRNEQLSKRKLVLTFGIIVNISLLCYFKYMDFFINNINFFTENKIELLNLALPLAISFFTLQQVAFLVDSYERLTEEKSFLDYMIFVTFFPQLIAGPIVHHKEMMPQFSTLKNKFINYENLAKGIFIFSIGLFKKVIIADTFSQWTAQGFDNSESLNFLEAWATSLSFYFQVYFDFSGYSDMAIGLALLFNIKLPVNFYSPYKACSIIDFWAKWHITLTDFFTTYLYTPLLKIFNKLTFEKAMLVTLVSLTITGFWHGGSWNFLIFGLLHGIAVVLNHTFRKYKLKLNKYLSWLLTFIFINFTFTIFRAQTWEDAIKVISGMIDFESFSLPLYIVKYIPSLKSTLFTFEDSIVGLEQLLTICLCFIIVLTLKNSIQLMNTLKLNYKTSIFVSLLLVFSIINMSNDIEEFIYFNF